MKFKVQAWQIGNLVDGERCAADIEKLFNEGWQPTGAFPLLHTPIWHSEAGPEVSVYIQGFVRPQIPTEPLKA